MSDYAIVVGIDDYPDFAPLLGAVSDARAFYAWLIDKSGGGVLDSNIEKVSSIPNPLSPLQSHIDDAFAAIFGKVRDCQKRNGNMERGRRLYLYFSGHGIASAGDHADVCLSNWSLNRRRSAILTKDYWDAVAELGLFEEVICFLDCCRVREVGARGRESDFRLGKPILPVARLWVAFASDFGSAAFEAVHGQDAAPRGHFTHVLLAGLRGGARGDGPDGISSLSLQAYLEREVPRVAAEHGHSQEPRFIDTFPAESKPYFGAPPAVASSNPVVIIFERSHGRVLLEDPGLRVLKDERNPTGEWRLELGCGHHVLRDEDSGEERLIRSTPGRGEIRVAF